MRIIYEPLRFLPLFFVLENPWDRGCESFFSVLEQEGGNSGEKPIKNCTVMTKNRVIKVVSCNNLYPFICTRNAGKIRCYVARYYDGLLFAALIATQ